MATEAAPKTRSLEIPDEDLLLQHRTWIFQRLGWGAMLLFLLAASLGLLGPGPLNDRIAGEKDSPLWIEYPRFGRFQAPLSLHVHVKPPGGSSGFSLTINRDYLSHLQLLHALPAPEKVEVGPERVTFRFTGQASDGQSVVDFRLQPDSIGTRHATITVDGGPSRTLSQFIYP